VAVRSIERMKCTQQGNVLISQDNKSEIRRIRDDQKQFVKPNRNTCNWLNTSVTKYENVDEAIKAVISTINFEVKHFKVLRLDDHINDLKTALSNSNQITTKVLIDKLHDTIQVNFNDIKYVQITGEFSETFQYNKQFLPK
jgi:hypothetical protein